MAGNGIFRSVISRRIAEGDAPCRDFRIEKRIRGRIQFPLRAAETRKFNSHHASSFPYSDAPHLNNFLTQLFSSGTSINSLSLTERQLSFLSAYALITPAVSADSADGDTTTARYYAALNDTRAQLKRLLAEDRKRIAYGCGTIEQILELGCDRLGSLAQTLVNCLAKALETKATRRALKRDGALDDLDHAAALYEQAYRIAVDDK